MQPLFGASLVLALAFSAPPPAEEAFTYSPYYPMQVGTTWNYKSGESKFTVTVKDHRRAGPQRLLCAHMETSQDGKVIGSEDVTVQDDWIVRVASDDKPINPPVKILELDKGAPKSDVWPVNSKVEPQAGGAAQSLAGTFVEGTASADEKAKLGVGDPQAPVAAVSCQDLDANGSKYSFKTYYVKEIGMAKQEITAGGLTVTLELEKDGFKAGSK
ncbi:MAG TPA: hypothetical protein VMS17_17360 [Gemmataceae bacterium]|nr:hypothetical protein [Gemmataceae bacterium]